jgi:hypothetical protein
MKTSRWSYQATVPRKQKLVSIWATPFQQEIAGAVLFAVCMFFFRAKRELYELYMIVSTISIDEMLDAGACPNQIAECFV